VIDISECLRAFLDKFPFASANVTYKHFCTARGTIMEILQHDLGFKSSPVDGRHISSAHHKSWSCQSFSSYTTPVATITTVQLRGNNNRRRALV
jgi:hypothetical protein